MPYASATTRRSGCPPGQNMNGNTSAKGKKILYGGAVSCDSTTPPPRVPLAPPERRAIFGWFWSNREPSQVIQNILSCHRSHLGDSSPMASGASASLQCSWHILELGCCCLAAVLLRQAWGSGEPRWYSLYPRNTQLFFVSRANLLYLTHGHGYLGLDKAPGNTQLLDPSSTTGLRPSAGAGTGHCRRLDSACYKSFIVHMGQRKYRCTKLETCCLSQIPLNIVRIAPLMNINVLNQDQASTNLAYFHKAWLLLKCSRIWRFIEI
jgi:hypothetical protein